MLTNVLLIGGAGFIGGHLKNKLESNGTTVDVIDKKQGKNILDEYAFTTSKNYSHVVFLAAEANLRAVRKNPVDAIKTMTTGLMNCLRCFPNSHFTYISSSMVYGNWCSDRVMEADARSPIDLYGQLKLAGEGIVKELHDNYTIIRPTAVYGPGDDPERVLPKFIDLARNNQELVVKGHNNFLDFTYVDDIVQGMLLAMNAEEKNKTYNISYGEAHALENVAKYICDTLGSGSVRIGLPDFEYPKRGALDISRAVTELGYKPRVNVFTGIDKLLELQ